MSTTVANPQAEILERALVACIPPASAAATSLMSLELAPRDVERMNELSAKARAGTLSDEEVAERDSYQACAELIGLLKDSARHALQQSPGGEINLESLPLRPDLQMVRRYSREQIAHRGNQLYEELVKHRVEPDRNGEFVVIDIETGEFEVDPHDISAANRLLARLPQGQLWLRRVGPRPTFRLGPRRGPRSFAAL